MVTFKRLGAASLAFSLFATSVLVSLISAVPVNAAADTCTWDGSSNAFWSDGGNWSGCDNGGVPETGDTLIFPESASNKAMNNNMAIVAASATVSGSGYTFGGNMFELSGTLNVFSTATFTPVVRFTSTTGQTGINVQSATPTFTGGIDLNLSASGFANFFTTSSSLDLPTITGTTPSIIFSGNPTLPRENYNTPTSAQTYTAGTISISRATVTCRATNCLGNSANPITISVGDTGAGARLSLDAAALSLANPITVNNFATGDTGIIHTIQNATLTGTITFTEGGTVSVATGRELNVNGSVSVAGGKTATFSGQGDPAFERIIQGAASVLSGAGNVTVDDVRVELGGNNTYSGTTTLAPGGVIQVFHNNGLGTTGGVTTVQSGAAISSVGALTIAENITLSGSGTSSWPNGALNNDSNTPTYTGTITLAGDTKIYNGTAATDININGVITGTGNLTYGTNTFGNTLVLGGASPNTYVGTITVTGSFLTLNKNGAVTGDIVIDDTGVNAFVDKTNGLTDAITDTAIITFDETSSANFSIDAGETETIGGLSGNEGNTFVGALGVLTLNVLGSQTSATSFSGGGTVVKTGAGTQTLTGGCAVSTGLSVSGGILVLDSTFVTTTCDATVNGGTLKGTGQINDVTMTSGKLAPGNSPGCMPISGNMTLSSGSVFEEEIAGATVCTQYDQTTVTGTATLGNATLQIVPSYQPTVGTVFTIIQAGSVSGTFNNLPDGASVTANGLTFRINYTGTTVVLTFLSGTLVATGFDAQTTMLISSLLLAGALTVSLRQRKPAETN